MAVLFDTTKQNVSLHINNIFKEGELDKISVVKDYLTTAPPLFCIFCNRKLSQKLSDMYQILKVDKK